LPFLFYLEINKIMNNKIITIISVKDNLIIRINNIDYISLKELEK